MPEMSSNIIVRFVSARQTRPLRASVLRPGQAAEKSVYPGDLTPDAFHLGAYAGDRLVGVASFYKESPRSEKAGANAWRLRGMAVVSEMQGKNCGS